VQWHEPGAVELRVPDRDHAGVEVDIATGETERFADPHAGGREQSEERLVRRRAKR
jgi:hypothetical protein